VPDRPPSFFPFLLRLVVFENPNHSGVLRSSALPSSLHRLPYNVICPNSLSPLRYLGAFPRSFCLDRCYLAFSSPSGPFALLVPFPCNPHKFPRDDVALLHGLVWPPYSTLLGVPWDRFPPARSYPACGYTGSPSASWATLLRAPHPPLGPPLSRLAQPLLQHTPLYPNPQTEPRQS